MLNRIRELTATVIVVVLVNTWREIEYRFDVFRANNGAHTEAYYLHTYLYNKQTN
jgi:hypothetical protein